MGRLQLDAARVEEIRRARLERPDTRAGYQEGALRRGFQTFGLGRRRGARRGAGRCRRAGGLNDPIAEKKLIGWFVGQVMKASRGKANPGLVNRILKQKLS